eukprot:gb/GECG01014453.1/.p1 GENE.gb/GECG01014453.1/~~gb/GECG01014453.1/.p1  ORF type:complete len:359 (+),score=24.10 gb/GECG01014453.1/:1-1077(+)
MENIRAHVPEDDNVSSSGSSEECSCQAEHEGGDATPRTPLTFRGDASPGTKRARGATAHDAETIKRKTSSRNHCRPRSVSLPPSIRNTLYHTEPRYFFNYPGRLRFKKLYDFFVPRKVSYPGASETSESRLDTRQDLDDLPKGQKLLRSVLAYDREWSCMVQNWKWPLLDLLLFPFAMTFGTYGIPVILAIMLPIAPAVLSLVMIVSNILTVILTSIGKKHFRRVRPTALRFAHRKPDVRALVNNESFPSGDSAQAAVVAFVMACYTGESKYLCIIPLTMWARVHFGCHWIGDTIVGASVGGCVALCTSLVLSSLNWCSELKELFELHVIPAILPEDVCGTGVRFGMLDYLSSPKLAS